MKVFGFVIVACGLILFLLGDFWKIKKVSCFKNGDFCGEEIVTDLKNQVLEKNLLFLSTKSLQERILRGDLTLKEVKIKKNPPAAVMFELKKREPAVAIGSELTEEGGGFLITDSEGIILAKAEKSDLPLILIRDLPALNVGTKFKQEEIPRTIEILNGLRLYLFEPRVAKITSSSQVEVWLKEERKVIFSLKKEAQQQLDSLQLIFSRDKIEGRNAKIIDLRFDKPVATYE